jgi:hypothetical protein
MVEHNQEGNFARRRTAADLLGQLLSSRETEHQVSASTHVGGDGGKQETTQSRCRT